MDARFALWLKARRWLTASLVVACVISAGVAWAVVGNSSAQPAVSTESPMQFRTALIGRLRTERLNYTWVVCVRTPHRFRGVGVVRCNVDFGIDPHVEAYCSVLRGGALLTSEQDPAIPCGHDDAGFSDPLVTYG